MNFLNRVKQISILFKAKYFKKYSSTVSLRILKSTSFTFTNHSPQQVFSEAVKRILINKTTFLKASNVNALENKSDVQEQW